MPTGTVARFDTRRGYGFIIPDDGGEDVFVHQNNIVMDGFRYLQPNERVSYELEVGEKGMKAVSVSLLEPRAPGSQPYADEGGGRGGDRGDRGDRGPRRDDRGPRSSGGPRRFDEPRGDRGPRPGPGGDRLGDKVGRLEKQVEKLTALLAAKGVLAAGEIDGGDAGDAAH